MRVILIEDVINLGKIGNQIDVKSGYARNFLIPTGRAKRATKENIEEFNAQRANYEIRQNQKLTDAKSRYEHINEKSFTVAAKAGVDGKLFGSVSMLDIAEAIKTSGVPIKKSEVSMPNGPLKNVGEFDVTIILHQEFHATVKINIIREDK